jgi:uracil-DNA glycosylase family 4
VAASGPEKTALLIVGLAPGLHGANKTGIPFNGDASGDLLFKVLRHFQLETRVRITNAVKCLPVENKPSSLELNNCQKFLLPEVEIHLQQAGSTVILCLGQIAHRSVIKALALKQSQYPFGHGAIHDLNEQQWLVDSYHCSRYNTQTGRLTESMFQSAVKSAAELAGYLT